jgi:hypothetical protein
MSRIFVVGVATTKFVVRLIVYMYVYVCMCVCECRYV